MGKVREVKKFQNISEVPDLRQKIFDRKTHYDNKLGPIEPD